MSDNIRIYEAAKKAASQAAMKSKTKSGPESPLFGESKLNKQGIARIEVERMLPGDRPAYVGDVDWSADKPDIYMRFGPGEYALTPIGSNGERIALSTRSLLIDGDREEWRDLRDEMREGQGRRSSDGENPFFSSMLQQMAEQGAALREATNATIEIQRINSQADVDKAESRAERERERSSERRKEDREEHERSMAREQERRKSELQAERTRQAFELDQLNIRHRQDMELTAARNKNGSSHELGMIQMLLKSQGNQGDTLALLGAAKELFSDGGEDWVGLAKAFMEMKGSGSTPTVKVQGNSAAHIPPPPQLPPAQQTPPTPQPSPGPGLPNISFKPRPTKE